LNAATTHLLASANGSPGVNTNALSPPAFVDEPPGNSAERYFGDGDPTSTSGWVDHLAVWTRDE